MVLWVFLSFWEGGGMRHSLRWTGKPVSPRPSPWLRVMADEALPPIKASESSALVCLGASCVFLCCWHSTLFLYTLVSHPTTIPDIQRLAGRGYFYWKIKNLSKLLFSFFLFLFFPPEKQGLQVV